MPSTLLERIQTNEPEVEETVEQSARYLARAEKKRGVLAGRPELGQQPLTFSYSVGVMLWRVSRYTNKGGLKWTHLPFYSPSVFEGYSPK